MCNSVAVMPISFAVAPIANVANCVLLLVNASISMLDYVLFAKLRYSFEFTIGIIKKVSLHPRFSVEASVADGFGDVVALDMLLTGEVGDGAGDLEDALIGSGGEVEVGHCTY